MHLTCKDVLCPQRLGDAGLTGMMSTISVASSSYFNPGQFNAKTVSVGDVLGGPSLIINRGELLISGGRDEGRRFPTLGGSMIQHPL